MNIPISAIQDAVNRLPNHPNKPGFFDLKIRVPVFLPCCDCDVVAPSYVSFSRAEMSDEWEIDVNGILTNEENIANP